MDMKYKYDIVESSNHSDLDLEEPLDPMLDLDSRCKAVVRTRWVPLRQENVDVLTIAAALAKSDRVQGEEEREYGLQAHRPLTLANSRPRWDPRLHHRTIQISYHRLRAQG